MTDGFAECTWRDEIAFSLAARLLLEILINCSIDKRRQASVVLGLIEFDDLLDRLVQSGLVVVDKGRVCTVELGVQLEIQKIIAQHVRVFRELLQVGPDKIHRLRPLSQLVVEKVQVMVHEALETLVSKNTPLDINVFEISLAFTAGSAHLRSVRVIIACFEAESFLKERLESTRFQIIVIAIGFPGILTF